MKNEKKLYQSPEMEVIKQNGTDMLSASGGNDAFDNWSSDIFGN